jgi:hypothetical protein
MRVQNRPGKTRVNDTPSAAPSSAQSIVLLLLKRIRDSASCLPSTISIHLILDCFLSR